MLAFVLSGTEHLRHSQYSLGSEILVSGGGVESLGREERKRGVVEVRWSWIKMKQMTRGAPDRGGYTMTGTGRCGCRPETRSDDGTR